MSKEKNTPMKKLITDELEAETSDLFAESEPDESAESAQIIPDDASDLPGFEHIDADVFDDDEFDEEAPRYGTIDKIIRIVTGALTLMLLGGSLVFWFIITKYLTVSPYFLADAVQMRSLMISCAAVPVVATVVMKLFRRSISSETWLLTMLVSGVAVIGIIALIQTKLRGVGMDASYLPSLICFAISGCALPSMIYLALRAAIERIAGWHGEMKNRRWKDVRRDVLALTSFRGLH